VTRDSSGTRPPPTGSLSTSLDAALGATWPALETRTLGPLTLRRGGGGGSRVSAATLDADGLPGGDILDAAEATMRSWTQAPTWRVRAGQADFDATLAARGHAIVDPTLFYAAPAAALADPPPPRLAAFDIWPPLAIQHDIWREAGIGPARIAVMHRASGPRTALFGRAADHPAATGFLAAHDGIAMLHALEVRPAQRRHGLARHLVAHAAAWALRHDCATLAVAVTEANAPARALYAGLGMAEAGGYHYRKGPLDA
jgi:GNAT superfamily N-acetyltransferase